MLTELILNFFPLLFDCRSLIARFTQIQVAHVHREVNRCADFLAKKECCMREGFVIFEASSSIELDRFFIFDVNGLYYYVPVWFHFLSPKRAFSKKLNQDLRLVSSKTQLFYKSCVLNFYKN